MDTNCINNFSKIIPIILVPIKKKRIKLLACLSIIGILLLGYYEFLLFQDLFQNTIPRQIYVDPFATASFYISSINTSMGHTIILNNLIIILAIATGIFTIAILVSSFKVKINIKKPEHTFIFLSFLGIFSILVFYMYFYWHQYIISIVAFFIIALATISKEWEFNKFRMFAICTLLLFFSVTLTKNRYEKSGIGWEISNQLVQTGIKPINVAGGDESWLPWWYFESTFKEVTDKQFGGNKYNITAGNWGTWRIIKPDSTCSYDISEVPLNYENSIKKGSKTILDVTTYYTLLTKKRFIAAENNCR